MEPPLDCPCASAPPTRRCCACAAARLAHAVQKAASGWCTHLVTELMGYPLTPVSCGSLPKSLLLQSTDHGHQGSAPSAAFQSALVQLCFTARIHLLWASNTEFYVWDVECRH